VIRPPRHPIARVATLLLVPSLAAWFALAAALNALNGPVATPRGPTVATPRAHLPEWIGRHNRFVARAMAGPVPLLFLGDSITRGWLQPAMAPGPGSDPLWRERFGSRGAENFGIDGDHVEHLLWRVRHGELARIEPRVVVLMIGTNNIALDPPGAIAEGVAAVVDEIHRRSPRTVIILIGLLPRGGVLGHGQPAFTDLADPRVPEVNRLIATLGGRPRVAFVDVGDRVLGPGGRIDRSYQPDLLHLSREGYSILAEAIEPTIRLLLGPSEPGGPDLLPGASSR
jgi:lysophospholipase L1-like esterase